MRQFRKSPLKGGRDEKPSKSALCRGPELNWRHMVLQTIALPTELPRRVSAQIRRSARGPLALCDTRDRLDHCPRYTIVLSRRVLRKGRGVTRQLGGRELAVVAA